MSLSMAPLGDAPIRTLFAQVPRLARVAAFAAIIAAALSPVAASAAQPGTDADRAGATAVHVRLVPLAVDRCGTAGHRPAVDDGEDHFDEGDDEFECDRDDREKDRCDEGDDDCEGGCANFDDGEDRCLDNGEDRSDEGDDELESGCANYDDGNDRCLDDGGDRFDEGNDEYGTAPSPTAARPEPSADDLSAAASTTPDLAGPGALAAVVGLGAGGLWLLRRSRS